MANKNTWRKRKAGVDGYGEKRGFAINTSSNEHRKSPKKNFKVKERVVQISNEIDENLVKIEKIKKKDA
jgi:hypothetical protein